MNYQEAYIYGVHQNHLDKKNNCYIYDSISRPMINISFISKFTKKLRYKRDLYAHKFIEEITTPDYSFHL